MSVRSKSWQVTTWSLAFIMLLSLLAGMSVPSVAAAPAAPAQTGDFQMVGQVGGVTRAVAAQGGYAYVASGLRLLVQQVTPNGMALTIGSSRPFSHFALGVAVKGRYAYVAAGSAGLRIIDVANPENPTEVGAWDSSGYAESVAIDAEAPVAYVADGPYGLRAVDVSDPTHPRALGSAFVTDYAYGVTVEAGRAYVASAGAGLLVVDATNPAKLVELATLDTPGYAYGVAVKDRTVYVGDGWEGLRVVDATDPAHPSVVGAYKPTGWVFDVTVSGDYAYLAAAYGGVRVVDITDPAEPREVGAFEVICEPNSGGPETPPGNIAGVAVDGSRLYAVDRKSGLMTLDVSLPTTPKKLGGTPPSDVAGLPCEGAVTRLYGLGVISGRPDGTFGSSLTVTRAELAKMLVVALGETATTPPTGGTPPGSPAPPTFKDVPADHWAASYVAAAAAAGITSGYPDGTFQPTKVVRGDEAITMALRAIHRRPTTGTALSDYLALATQLGLTDGLGINPAAGLDRGMTAMLLDRMFYDVTDGASGRTLAESRHALAVEGKLGWADSVAVQGNYAYIAGGACGFAVIDLTDPTRPTQVASYPLNTYATTVKVVGHYAYVAANTGDEQGLHVFDISRPDRPIHAGFYWVHWIGAYQDMTVDGGRAYIVDERGLEVLSLADPTKPQRLGYIEFWDSQKYSTAGVAASGNTAYVVANAGGLFVIDVTDPADPRVLVRYKADWGPTRASIRGNLLYLLGTNRVEAVDVSDPANPKLAAGLDLPAVNFGAVEATPDGIYLAGGTKGLSLVQNQGTAISRVASFNTLGSAVGVAVDGDLAVVADGQNGLVVLRRGTAVTAAPLASDLATRATATWTPTAWPIEAAIPPIETAKVTTASVGASSSREVIREVVTSTADKGPGTLRSYLESAKPGMVITFDPTVFPKDDPAVIAVDSRLPEITCGFVTIDGRGAGVILDGSRITTRDQYVIPDGLRLSSEGNVVMGLEIRNFPGHGIFLAGGWRNTIGGLLPGEGNVVYGNGWHGITMLGKRAFGNNIVGNYCGTDRTGTFAPGSAGHGISMEMGAWGNLIQGNLCSGNNRCGINIGDEGSSFNTIVGNIIGTDVTGTKALLNKECGISAGYFGASFNRIGGTAPGEGNLISGNFDNINLDGPGAEGCLVLGNRIGATLSGSAPSWPPAFKDITVYSAFHAMIGGAGAAEANVITGAQTAVSIDGDFNFVLGNNISKGSDDQSPGRGVSIDGEHNWVQGNVVSGTLGEGVRVEAGQFNTIRRNIISGYLNRAIDFQSGGNSGVKPPIISRVTADSVSGTAAPGTLVEVYSLGEDKTMHFEGETVADAAGSFTFRGSGPFHGTRVMCTATDGEGNTSEGAGE